MFLVIELACGEYGELPIQNMINATKNGSSLTYFQDGDKIPMLKVSRGKNIYVYKL